MNNLNRRRVGIQSAWQHSRFIELEILCVAVKTRLLGMFRMGAMRLTEPLVQVIVVLDVQADPTKGKI